MPDPSTSTPAPVPRILPELVIIPPASRYTPSLAPTIDPLEAFEIVPPAPSLIALYRSTVTYPALVTVPADPVINMPNETPLIDPVALLVALPPSSKNTAALPVPVAAI